MTSRSNNSRRIVAAVATLLLHGLLLTALLSMFMCPSGSSEVARQWPPADSSEILFGGEYVMIGDTPEDAAEAAEDNTLMPAETQQEQEPLLTQQTTPAPEAVTTTVPPKEKKAPETPAKPAATATDKARKEAAANIGNRVKFGTAKGATGSPDGDAATGAVSGIAASGLGNRSAVELPRPARSPMGKIVVSVKVNRDGRVTSAAFLNGEGAAAADAATRRRCVDAARRAKFTPSVDAPVSQIGTLTYTFK